MPIRRQRPGPPAESLWITNLSKNIVSLPDLGIHMQPYCSINLLDTRHYHLTKEQIFASINTGCIAKSAKIVVRAVPPEGEKPKFIPQDHNAIFPARKRYSPEIKNNEYEELSISDSTYAEENADMAVDNSNQWTKKE